MGRVPRDADVISRAFLIRALLGGPTPAMTAWEIALEFSSRFLQPAPGPLASRKQKIHQET